MLSKVLVGVLASMLALQGCGSGGEDVTEKAAEEKAATAAATCDKTKVNPCLKTEILKWDPTELTMARNRCVSLTSFVTCVPEACCSAKHESLTPEEIAKYEQRKDAKIRGSVLRGTFKEWIEEAFSGPYGAYVHMDSACKDVKPPCGVIIPAISDADAKKVADAVAAATGACKDAIACATGKAPAVKANFPDEAKACPALTEVYKCLTAECCKDPTVVAMGTLQGRYCKHVKSPC